MGDNEVSESGSEPGGEPEAREHFHYAMRFASVFLRLPVAATDDSQESVWLPAIAEALERDPRVSEVREVEPRDDFPRSFLLYESTTDQRDLLRGESVFSAAAFASPPIEFSVECRAKIQRTWHDTAVASERYCVIWNGMSLAVAWEDDIEQSRVPMSAHVVLDVLEEAVRAAGFDLYIQACSPGCDYQFAHTGIRAYSDADTEIVAMTADAWSGDVWMEVPPLLSGVETLKGHLSAAFGHFRRSMEFFGRMKNEGQRVLDLEYVAWEKFRELMAVMEADSNAKSQSLWPQLRERWRKKGWRKHARHLISDLWALIAQIEEVRRDWSRTRFIFEEESERFDRKAIFEQDHADDAARISSLDVSIMQNGIEHAAVRLDNRAVVAATAWGALGGAVAGAVAAALVTQL